MALSKAEIKTAYPLPVYNYRVEIAGVAVGFSEVSGLAIKHEVTTYKESPVGAGSPGPITMHMPAQATPPTITLKKGLVKANSVPTLFAWINATQINQIDKKDVYVRLCDEEGKAVVSWKVLNAFPTSLTAPTFTASSNDAAIESLELRGDRILIEEA
ncbi:MAG TPA: phage tail protein [Kofleriaceae bacterium]